MTVPRLLSRRRTPPDRWEESEMTREQILALGTAFAAFLRLFAGCFCQQRSRDHLLAYCRVALEQLDRVRGNGLEFDWLTFDEGYGGKPGFLRGLDERRLVGIGEVPKSFRCLTRLPRRIPAKGVKGK